MKHSLITILALTFLFYSCENNDEITYTDITGNWQFSNEYLIGEFTISKTLDDTYAIENIKLNWHQYGLVEHIGSINQEAFIIDGLNISHVWGGTYANNWAFDGKSDEGNPTIHLLDVTYSTDFKTLRASSQKVFIWFNSYDDEDTIEIVIEEELTITRR